MIVAGEQKLVDLLRQQLWDLLAFPVLLSPLQALQLPGAAAGAATMLLLPSIGGQQMPDAVTLWSSND